MTHFQATDTDFSYGKKGAPIKGPAQGLFYRSRYCTDSGIIGGKAFVSETYQKAKEAFQAKRDKIPKPISGLSGIYSLKRLTEKSPVHPAALQNPRFHHGIP